MLAYKVVEVSTFCDYTEVHYTSAFFLILLLIIKDRTVKLCKQ